MAPARAECGLRFGGATALPPGLHRSTDPVPQTSAAQTSPSDPEEAAQADHRPDEADDDPEAEHVEGDRRRVTAGHVELAEEAVGAVEPVVEPDLERRRRRRPRARRRSGPARGPRP